MPLHAGKGNKVIFKEPPKWPLGLFNHVERFMSRLDS